MIYEPNDDSFLLKEFVLQYAYGSVLDMGTGSGIQAEAALTKTSNVIAVDINPEVVSHCQRKGIHTVRSDLFEKVPDRFDVIIFNPPYLPEERDYCGILMTQEDFTYVNDVALVGGKHGWETIDRFLKDAQNHLYQDGKILLSFSSLSGNVLDIIQHYGYHFKLLGEKRIFFEVLSVYLLWV